MRSCRTPSPRPPVSTGRRSMPYACSAWPSPRCSCCGRSAGCSAERNSCLPVTLLGHHGRAMKLSMYGSRLRRVARRHFGWPSLRPGQFRPMRAVLRRRDALVILPTGAGKSAIYQVPAVLLPGPTIVISPLLALQQDQITALNDHDDPRTRAVRVSSAETPNQQREAIREIREGRAEFLFITPEQLSDPDRLAEVRALRPGLVAVDEA